jgi:putative membrane protein
MDPRDLPTLNATLNAVSACLLALGYVFIRRGRRNAHRAAMLAACATSTLFLISYLVYHYQVGSVRFARPGFIRVTYLSMLASHTLLAAALPALAAVTLTRALRGNWPRHRAIARWTLPIWLYVSVTGVIVYWMLYHL